MLARPLSRMIRRGSTCLVTERRGRVVNTPVIYSGCPVFKSRPQPLAILIEVFRGFAQSLYVNAEYLEIRP
jgi:hypothetical protein